MHKNELHALLKLIDDSDEGVYRVVRKKLLKAGEEVLPVLKQKRKETKNILIRKRLGGIIKQVVFRQVRYEMKIWSKQKNNDILYGAFLVAKSQFPNLKFSKIEADVKNIANEIKSKIYIYHTALQKIQIINTILFNQKKFKGNNINFLEPDYSLINKVLKSKVGCSIIIAILYRAVTKSLNLPVYIIDFPQNMLLGYLDQKMSAEIPERDVYFYISPYNKGFVIIKRDLDLFLDSNKIKRENKYYLPVSNNIVITHLIKYLIKSYKASGATNKISRLDKLIKIF